MAFTQAQIDALRTKINAFAGVRATSFGDQSTTFDMESALALLERMEREVNGTVRTRYAVVNKGLDGTSNE